MDNSTSSSNEPLVINKKTIWEGPIRIIAGFDPTDDIAALMYGVISLFVVILVLPFVIMKR